MTDQTCVKVMPCNFVQNACERIVKTSTSVWKRHQQRTLVATYVACCNTSKYAWQLFYARKDNCNSVQSAVTSANPNKLRNVHMTRADVRRVQRLPLLEGIVSVRQWSGSTLGNRDDRLATSSTQKYLRENLKAFNVPCESHNLQFISWRCCKVLGYSS